MRFCIGICLTAIIRLEDAGIPIYTYLTQLFPPDMPFGSTKAHGFKILLNPKKLKEKGYLASSEQKIQRLIAEISRIIEKEKSHLMMGLIHQALIQAWMYLKNIRLGRSRSLQAYHGQRPDCLLSGYSHPVSYSISSICCIPDLSDYENITRAICHSTTVWYFDWDNTLVDNSKEDIFFDETFRIFQETCKTHRTEILTARSSPFSLVSLIQSLLKDNDLESNTLQVPVARETVERLRANAHKITPDFIQQLKEQMGACKSLSQDKETLMLDLIDLLQLMLSYDRNLWQYDALPDSQLIIFTNEYILQLLNRRYQNPKVLYLVQQHRANNTPYLLVDDRKDTNREVNQAGGNAVDPEVLITYYYWVRLTQDTVSDDRIADVTKVVSKIKLEISPWLEAMMQKKLDDKQSMRKKTMRRFLLAPSASRIAPAHHAEEKPSTSKNAPGHR